MYPLPGKVSTPPAHQLAHSILQCRIIGVVVTLQSFFCFLKKSRQVTVWWCEVQTAGWIWQQCPSTFYDGLWCACWCMATCCRGGGTTSDVTLSSLNAHPCGVRPVSKMSEVLLLHDNAGHSTLCTPQRPSAYSPAHTPVDHHRQ